MKLPKLFSKRPALFARKPSKPYRAVARRAAPPAVDDYDQDEPTTKLSSAFIVVLILHLVAVAGIYAFNSIKAARRGREVPAASAVVAPSVAKPAAKNGLVATPQASGPVSTEARPETAPQPAGPKAYHVRSGDTVARISNQFGVSAASLQEANNLKEGAVLVTGQTLTIPAKQTTRTASPGDTTKPSTAPKGDPVGKTYVVKKGDSAVSIARAQNVNADELLKLNKISDPKKLQLGQTLKLPPKKN